MKYLVTISSASPDADATAALIGGKAHQQLAAALEGLPVTPGVVLTSAAFPGRDWLLTQEIQKPLDQVRATEEHLLSLGIDVPALLASFSAGRFAFRSSATMEDSGRASFAGTFHTSLDVLPANAYAAIFTVWGSTFSKRVEQYLADLKLSDEVETLQMAVLIQPMLAPLLSGVAFSHQLGQPSDPYVFVGVVPGVGEPLVQGEVDAQVYYIERGTWSIVGHSNADDLPVIYECAGQIGRTVDYLEATRGVTQDIEFAIMRDRAFILLQNRPLVSGRVRRDSEQAHD